ncbi:MAG: preprotein translocase subunit YajC [Lentisphaerae bacterium]|nr:preprotein translocase subunit YajC [Lentisphaerota bacterium]
MIGFMNAVAMAGPGGGGGKGSPMGMLVPMLFIFGIFYFMLIRPQQRKEKERRRMIEELKTGDRVLFSGGILGTVTNSKEQTLVLKIADNVKVEVARGAINKVLEKGEKVSIDDEKKA